MLKEIKATKRSIKKDASVVRADLAKKEAAVSLALRTPTGIARIAAALGNPVRKYLDYVPINRKCVVVEPIPDGDIPYFDADIEEFYATKIAADGTTQMFVCNALRTQVDEFEIVTKPKVPYKELRVRKYKVLDRVKERIKQGIALREDNLWLGLWHTASVATNTEQAVATALTKDVLAVGFQEIDQHRLIPASVILNPYGISGMRRWDRTQIDETARIEIREKGYLGNLWGANFFITTLVTSSGNYTYGYILAQPQFCSWFPIRADAEIIPADRPDDLLLGWVGYELVGMIVHNNKGIARVKFANNL